MFPSLVLSGRDDHKVNLNSAAYDHLLCGTSDAIFALHTLITSSLANNKRLYCAFIDFKKAFDSVDRSKLWMKLSKIGI